MITTDKYQLEFLSKNFLNSKKVLKRSNFDNSFLKFQNLQAISGLN